MLLSVRSLSGRRDAPDTIANFGHSTQDNAKASYHVISLLYLPARLTIVGACSCARRGQGLALACARVFVRTPLKGQTQPLNATRRTGHVMLAGPPEVACGAVAAAINSLVLLTFLTPFHSALEFQVTVIHGDLLHIPCQTSHTPSTSPHVSCAILFGPLWRNSDQSEPPHDISHNVPGQRPNFTIAFPDNRARLGIVAQFFRISGRERDSWSLTDCVVGSPVCHRQIPINFTYNS